MKASERYFRLTRRLTGWAGNYGIRLSFDFPKRNPWTHLTLSMGVRRSRLWQWWPLRWRGDRCMKKVQLGFGLVHFTLTFNY